MKTKIFLGMLAAVGWLAANAHAQVTVSTVTTNGLHEPVGVTADFDGNLYVADSVNNRIAKIDPSYNISTLSGTGAAGTNDGPFYLAQFSHPQGVLFTTINGTNGLIVSDYNNNSIRFVTLTNGMVSLIAGKSGTAGSADGTGVTARFRYPVGMSLDSSNNLYVADSFNNSIRVVNLNAANFTVTTLAVPGANFFRPNAVAVGSFNQLWVADTDHHVIKLITLSTPTNGTLTTVIGAGGLGSADSLIGANAGFAYPRGLLWLAAANQLVVSDTGNHTLRLLTNYTAVSATNYSVSTYAGTAGQTGFADGAALASKFNSPFGLAQSPLPFTKYFFVADQANNAIRKVQNGEPPPKVPTPQIGWVSFPYPEFLSVLHPGSSFVFYNDALIAIQGTNGSQTFFTSGATPASGSIPDPSAINGSTPPAYEDNLPASAVTDLPGTRYPDMTIKAIGTKSDGSPSSDVVECRFQFIVGTPTVSGDNAAQFVVSNITANAQMWYTTNGIEPTNVLSGSNFGPIPSDTTLSLRIASDTTFKIRGFRDKYQPSGVATVFFSPTNFQANRISFGITNGEPSSVFLARPGQFFYAPVTLSVLPGQRMFGLQFNITVTNSLGTTNKILNGAGIDFFSMLMSEVPKEEGTHLPPDAGQWYLSIPPFLMTSPALSNQVGYAQFVNTNNNLLGIGWLFRQGYKYTVISTNIPPYYYLDFDTTKHDLIKHSIVHDTLFEKDKGVVVVGAYSFGIPTNANIGDKYYIQIGSPSATRDGIGEPGSDVFIQAPATNQAVTVGTPYYLVGDVAPFRWLNAGDFGEGILNNADVMQVFQSAILGVDTPPFNSDLYRAMDSCGNIGFTNNGSGYLTNAGSYLSHYPVTNTAAGTIASCTYTIDTNTVTFTTTTNSACTSSGFSITNITVTATTNIPIFTTDTYVYTTNTVPGATNFVTYVATNILFTNPNLNHLFDGNDQTINQVAFGDLDLDVCDVYVTFRRSLDPSLTWFRRFWTNSQFVAVTTPNLAYNSNSPSLKPAAKNPSAAKAAGVYAAPSVIFTAGDGTNGAGQTVQIPITAKIFGDYPLRVLGLNLTVHPLDGSPAITAPVQFTPNGALGLPGTTLQPRPNTYAAVWLNSGIAGLSGDVPIGTLQITLPANASASAAYAVSFDHVSASPNGLAAFPKTTCTGIITASDRSGSSWNDGISDTWRLRNFGTIYNQLSAAHADADGDGDNNLKEFKTGTNPNDAQSVLRVLPNIGPFNVRWPSIQNKTYITERSTTLFGGNWSPISTNTGTGGDIQIQDNNAGGGTRFYRVRVAE
ncbi:MAG: hypothetical protein NTZ16_04890 [Verrucomicrobia bacterium]|nr:hypothetical protein [Verrucomicrobiota bacterium]